MLIAVVVVLAGLLWVCMSLLSAGVSIDHARREIVLQRQAAEQLQSMLRHATQGMSQSELKKILTDDIKGAAVVKEEDEKIAIGSIVFYFRDDHVSDVTVIFEDPNY